MLLILRFSFSSSAHARGWVDDSPYQNSVVHSTHRNDVSVVCRKSHGANGGGMAAICPGLCRFNCRKPKQVDAVRIVSGDKELVRLGTVAIMETRNVCHQRHAVLLVRQLPVFRF